jgi:hypothetical protein
VQKGIRNTKRTLVKKITSLNLYADQATQIRAIMEDTGARKEAPLMRELLDEALSARRRKSIHRTESEQPSPAQDSSETLQTVQTLLLKLIRQADTSLRAQGISLILLQEVLAETSAGRKISWNRLEVPALSQTGMTPSQIDEQFAATTNDAKDYAYGVAEEIRRNQSAQLNSKVPSAGPTQLSFETEE